MKEERRRQKQLEANFEEEYFEDHGGEKCISGSCFCVCVCRIFFFRCCLYGLLCPRKYASSSVDSGFWMCEGVFLMLQSVLDCC